MGECECKRKKHRTGDERHALLRRLDIIEGQVRGVRNMIENDGYCPDILTQISAITSALGSLSRELLCSHIESCVAEDIRDGKEGAPRELAELVKRLLK